MKDVNIRPITMDDSFLLYCWFNSDDSLKWKEHTKQKISQKTHENWLRSRLSDKTTQIFIIEIEDRSSGQVRLEKIDKIIFVDIFIIAQARGKGIASFALQKAIEYYTESFGRNTFCATVHVQNQSSQKLFTKTGFIKDSAEAGDWVKFFLNAG